MEDQRDERSRQPEQRRSMTHFAYSELRPCSSDPGEVATSGRSLRCAHSLCCGPPRVVNAQRMDENAGMDDERLRSEIRDEQERIISAVRSARDHWEMAKAEDSFADLLERMADELHMYSAHDRGRFLAAAQALRRSAADNEQRYVTALSRSTDGA